MSFGVSVIAVVVTYHPEIDSLKLQLEALSPQVSKIIIIDNGSDIGIQEFIDSIPHCTNIVTRCLGANLGIGHAQNVGIDYAVSAGAEYVALFDQDSLPASDMIEKLYNAASALQGTGVRLAAVGPAYKDTNNGVLSGFVRVGLFGFARIQCKSNNKPIEADFLISSGSLIPIDTLKAVGGVDSSLFIDHVDTEWCFRAKSEGYRIFGVCTALMMHSLGDRRGRIWFLRWRTVPYHSPFRYYYMFRNSIILIRRPYMPFFWKVADVFRCIRSAVYFGVFGSARRDCLRMMSRGIADGLRGLTGKMNER